MGYSVAWRNSVTVGDTVNVPANEGGTIEWARRYNSKDVTQEEYWYIVPGPETHNMIGNYAYATTRRYVDIAFRFVPS